MPQFQPIFVSFVTISKKCGSGNVVGVVVGKQEKCGKAKQGDEKVKKLLFVVKRVSSPSSSLNMHGLGGENQ